MNKSHTALANAGRPLTLHQIEKRTGYTSSVVTWELMQASVNGQVERLKDGRFTIAVGKVGR